jgi:pyruvate dehydrogenase E2 component (dihydrolipoamide acetyltransferase)
MANIVEMPKLGFDMAEGTLVNWVKAEGEKIKKGEVLAEIETDKATIQVDTSFEGIVYKHLVEVKSHVPVGTPIAIIAGEGEKVNLEQLLKKEPEKPALEQTPSKPNPQPIVPQKKISFMQTEEEKETIKASPVAKTMAKESGIDISKVKGSGPEGRIVKRDIDEYLKEQSRPIEGLKITSAGIPADQIHEVSKLRLAIGKRMLEAKQTTPHFYLTRSFDVANLQLIRKEMNEVVEQEGHISVNDFIIRATALSLRQLPALNAKLSGDQIIVHGHINIGVAVSVENGLLTVVCRDADQKNISTISQEIKLMSKRVREGKLRPDDIEGSTFTISNLGMYDVENFTAIINPPEAAILAVSTINEEPVVLKGIVTIGQRMKMTLSADHRVTDGVEVAKFMQVLSKFIEQPWRLV